MKYRPHDYQKYAIEYIISHPVSAVFLDCGLGKTSITLAAIKRLLEAGEIRKVLVVAPLRVATVSWPDELNGWIDFRSLSYSVVTGTAKERTEALKRDVSIYIINRENLQWLVEKSGVPFSYEMVVLDELSSFKNWNSKRFKAFMKVRPFVKRVVGLTGTPSSGGLIDLFAEFKCLDMGRRLGRFITQYRTAFFRPGRSNGNIVYEYIPLPDAEERIYEKISDITISMRAMDHLDMPELITARCIVRMSDKERQLYERMKKELVIPLDGDVITAANAAALSGKLSQMANGCVYSDDGTESVIHDRKLDALEDYVFNIPAFAKNFKRRKPSTDHWMNFSIGSSACHIAVSQIQKRDELDVELYINDDPDLYNSLLENKENIESLCGLSFDWRELPDRKASRIVLEKSVQFANKSQWESQFEWLADVMVKMKAAFCRYI